VLTAALAGALGLGALLATPNRGCIQGQLRSIAIGLVGVAAFAGVFGAVWGARTAHPWRGAGAIVGAIVVLYVIPHIIRVTRVRSFTSERLADIRAAAAQMLVVIPTMDVRWRHRSSVGPPGHVEMSAEWTGETEVAGRGKCSAGIDTYEMPRTGPLDGAVRSVNLYFEPESPADIRSQEEALSLLGELAVVSPPRDLREKLGLDGVLVRWSTRRDPLERLDEPDGVSRSRSTEGEERSSAVEIDVFRDGKVDASYYSWPTESLAEIMRLGGPPGSQPSESMLRRLQRWGASLGW
jgi:hypothetical protein